MLGRPEIIADQPRFRGLAKEYARLEPLVVAHAGYRRLLDDIGAAEELRDSDDPEAREMGESELAGLLEERQASEQALLLLLVPADPDDDANLFLGDPRRNRRRRSRAVRRGTCTACTSASWRTTAGAWKCSAATRASTAVTRRSSARVAGKRAYARLKFESGTHRVQRVPETGVPGANPYVRLYGCHHARTRGRGRCRDQPGRPAGGHVPRIRRRRPAREQDRLGGPPDTPAQRHRRGMPGRTVPAQEPRPGAVAASGEAEGRRHGPPAGGNRRAPAPDGGFRGPFGANTHI